ncbi:MAG: hypothetical protein BroJett040_13920 [Oligoflexia bacterium]|nr:MAG: hypothetical protein BroJett040_13920 [Oligoflexia bacterium]
MIKRIIIITILLMSTAAHGDWMQGIFDKAPLAGPCRKKIDVPRKDVDQLWKDATQLKEDRKYCESAAYYHVLIGEAQTPEQISSAWYQKIESFFFQYDYDKFFETALDYLESRKGSHLAEKVHYLVVKAVNELMQENRDLSNPWLQFGLGIHPEQFAKDAVKNMMKFRSFIEAYPQSEYLVEVQSYLNGAKITFNSDYLKQSRMLVLRREYAPAIVRYQYLLNLGLDFQERGVATFELIQLLREFSYSVQNENIVSTQKLARWLTTAEIEVTTSKRQMLSQTLFTQSQKLLQLMKEKMPNDPWTKRAIEYFN